MTIRVSLKKTCFGGQYFKGFCLSLEDLYFNDGEDPIYHCETSFLVHITDKYMNQIVQ
ncbi:unnamed protein product, partial [Mesorhabditis belari]|uniref:Uncharacterized protein n=1 Tax=Mesorhabditis belari TaxID=2138241 RepID=A0AAF3F9T1_9BILA